jgi:DMSO/TMAO reductase YedYZ molybdopterin-dependent catalytic subunit
MIPPDRIGRRRFIGRTAGSLATLSLSSCHVRSRDSWLTRVLDTEVYVDEHVQPWITPPGAHGKIYTAADISHHFKSNGTHYPSNPLYRSLAKSHFANWHLKLDGLVDRPMRLSLADLLALPSVTQITRQDCVEGWSCIGQWTGVPLRTVLGLLRVHKRARYVMFFCYDTVTGAHEPYYESIDLVEAMHHETILAYGMNGQILPIPYGAPLRLRLGRQLGYKMAKYLYRIELVESFRHIEGGHGGFYEDNGYAWYAGI